MIVGLYGLLVDWMLSGYVKFVVGHLSLQEVGNAIIDGLHKEKKMLSGSI